MPILFTSKAIAPPVPPVLPTIAMASSAVLQRGEEATIVFTGDTQDDVYAWTVLAAPSGAVASGAATATLTLTWTPSTVGEITLELQLSDGGGYRTERSFVVEVVDEAEETLSVSAINNPTGAYDLSDNAADFVAFAHTTATDVTQKAGADLITDLALVGNPTAPRNAGAGSVPTLSWSGGDSPATATGVTAALARWKSNMVSGYTFKLASSSASTRTARLFFRMRSQDAGVLTKIRVSAAFGSGTPVIREVSTTSVTASDHCVEIIYQSSEETPLTVTIDHRGEAGAFFLRAIQLLGGSGASLTADPSAWTVKRGSAFLATVTLAGVTDLTGVELFASGLPAGATFSASGAVGTVRWTPPLTALNSYTLGFTARRGSDVLARLTIQLATTAPDPTPVAITAPNSWTLTVGTAATLAASATGVGALTLRASGLRGRSVFVCKPASGSVSGTGYWTPEAADVTTTPFVLTLTATDSEGRTATKTINVTVNAAS